jgi:hypothetical protein
MNLTLASALLRDGSQNFRRLLNGNNATLTNDFCAQVAMAELLKINLLVATPGKRLGGKRRPVFHKGSYTIIDADFKYLT